MPSQPQAQLWSPEPSGAGRGLQTPIEEQSGASQYSVAVHSFLPQVHVSRTPFDPRPDGSGPPKNDPQPAAASRVATTATMRPRWLVCMREAFGGLAAARGVERRLSILSSGYGSLSPRSVRYPHAIGNGRIDISHIRQLCSDA